MFFIMKEQISGDGAEKERKKAYLYLSTDISMLII